MVKKNKKKQDVNNTKESPPLNSILLFSKVYLCSRMNPNHLPTNDVKSNWFRVFQIAFDMLKIRFLKLLDCADKKILNHICSNSK